MLKWDTKAPKTYHEPTQRDECKEWLEDFLKAHPEGVKVKEVIEAAKEEGLEAIDGLSGSQRIGRSNRQYRRAQISCQPVEVVRNHRLAAILLKRMMKIMTL